MKVGTYELIGSNDESDVTHYRGKVIIAQQGTNYSLLWKIGSNQVQVGVGMLHDDLLSVAYFDVMHQAGGVVSYHCISEDEIEGKWASLQGTSYGRESLIWKSEETLDTCDLNF